MLAYLAILNREALLAWRDRAGLCLLLVVPALTIAIGGFALQAFFAGASARIVLRVDDRDGGAAASELVERLGKVSILDITEQRSIGGSHAGSTLVIPPGFTAAYERGEEVKLVLETDPGSRELDVVRAVLSEARARLLAGQVTARLAAAQILARTGDLDLPRLRRESLEAVSESQWRGVEIIETFSGTPPPRLRSFDVQVPGMAVMFLLFGTLSGVGRRILDDGEAGRLRRMLMTPASSVVMLAALLSARVLIGVVQVLILLLFGHVVFALPLGASLLVLVGVVTVVVVSAVACGLLMGSVARTDEQLTMLGVAVILTMAAVGGCWWPLFVEPAWMQSLASITLTKWAMRALTAVLLQGAGLRDILVSVVMLAISGALMLALGMLLYQRRWASQWS